MKIERILFAIVIFSMLACGPALMAERQKFAVVDMKKLFDDYYKSKIANANLKKQAEVYKEYAERLNESRLKLQEEFKELRDASLNIALSESEKENKRLAAQDKYRQWKAKEAEYTQYNQDKQKKLLDAQSKQRMGILDEIKALIRKRCVLEGYTIVFDVSGKTLNDIPSIIYFNPSVDLTESVLKELNRGQPDEK